MKEGKDESMPALSRKSLREYYFGTHGEEVWLDWDEEKGEIFVNLSLTGDEEWRLENFREDADKINQLGEDIARQHGVKFRPLDAEDEIKHFLNNVESGREYNRKNVESWTKKLEEAGVSLDEYQPISSISVIMEKPDTGGDKSDYHKLIKEDIVIDGVNSKVYSIGGGHIVIVRNAL